MSTRKENFEDNLDDDVIDFTGYGAGISSASKIYADNVTLNARMGHGYAAEKVNNIFDVINGKDAQIVGGNNALNGADRLVDGIEIQSKYCKTGADCIKECFDGNGTFRYMSNGRPMKIEVPSDKYEEALSSMRTKIAEGKIPNVTDPNEAENIVQKGSVTYEQAKNIAKFGTVEGLAYDAVNGIQTFATAFGVSALITFAKSIWNNEDVDVALQNACCEGIKVGGVSWISGIIGAQVGRTGVELGLRGATDSIVRLAGPKAASLLSTATNKGIQLYGGAALNHASKILRGNVVTGAITTAVLSSVDIARLFSGKMSGAQCFKNIAKTASGVAGGTGGWMGGAAAGAALGSFFPGIGTMVGGFVGGLAGAFTGGSIASATASAILDGFIEDDAKEMLRIVQKQFETVAFDYMLSKEECEEAIDEFKALDVPDLLRDMYASKNRKEFAKQIVESIVEDIAANRPAVPLPSNEKILESLQEILQN